ncbi:hypothetical protein EP7_004284 [Isosphaeraceae bacterium EP7]
MQSVEASELSGRINHEKINQELEAAGFPEVGWLVRYDDGGAVKAIEFDFEERLGYDAKRVGDVFRSHLRLPEEKDDLQEAEERVSLDSGKTLDLEAQIAALTERVTLLERRNGGSEDGGSD